MSRAFLVFTTIAGLTVLLVSGCGRYPERTRDRRLVSAGQCIDRGLVYQVGETFRSSDGCNRCSCSLGPDGNPEVVCTEKACGPDLPNLPDFPGGGGGGGGGGGLSNEQLACYYGGGIWRQMTDGCGDRCGKAAMLCTQAIQPGCDCGPYACWTGSRCVYGN